MYPPPPHGPHHVFPGYYQPNPLALPPGHVRCPYCGWTGLALTEQKTATAGWVLGAVLLVVCFVLAWIPPLTMKVRRPKCGGCGAVLGGG